MERSEIRGRICGPGLRADALHPGYGLQACQRTVVPTDVAQRGLCPPGQRV